MHVRRGLWTGVVALLAAVPTTQAAGPPQVRCAGAAVDRAGGPARLLERCGDVAPGAGGPEATARAALDRLGPALGLPAGLEARPLGVVQGPAGTVVRLQQTVGGVPVRDAQVVVALGDGGRVDWIRSEARRDPRPPSLEPEVGRAQATATASARVPGGTPLGTPVSDLVVAPRPGGRAVLAWDVRVTTDRPLHEWRVLVSATTGSVLEVVDELRRVDGSGRSHRPNPVQATGNTGLRDNADAPSPALDAARADVTLPALADGDLRLRGTFADLTAPGVSCSSGHTPGSASSADRRYAYNRGDDRFEEVVAYDAVTRTGLLARRLGFTDVLARPLPVHAHCIADDNSFYSSGWKAVVFGDGGVDDAEDAEVVVHEVGHAVQDEQVPGWGPGSTTEQRAIGEGFGDLLAVLVHLQDGAPAYQAGSAGGRWCVAEWDATSYNPATAAGGGCLRRTDGRDEQDGAAIGNYSGTPAQVHRDGRFWSTALTCVLEGIEQAGASTADARDEVLRLVLAHHRRLVPTSGNEGFDDSVRALLAVDLALTEGERGALIRRCAAARLAVTLPPDTTPPVVTPVLDPPAPTGAGGWHRETVRVSWKVRDPESEVAAEGCGPVVVDADTAGRELTCTVTSAGGATSRVVTVKRDATPPALAPSLSDPDPEVGDAVTATPGATDATSGVADAACDPVDTTSPGTRTLRCTATDVAGGVAEAQLAYTVRAGPPTATTGTTTTPGTTVTPTPAPGPAPGPPVPAPRPTAVPVPRLVLRTARVLRDGRVRVRVTSDRPARVRLVATRGGVRLRSSVVALRAGRARTVVLTAPRRTRARLQRLARRRAVALRVVAEVRPTGGRLTTVRRTVKAPRTR